MARRVQNRMVAESVPSAAESEPGPVVIPEPPRGPVARVLLYENGWAEAFGADHHQLRGYAGLTRDVWPRVRDAMAEGGVVLAANFRNGHKPITAAQRAALDSGDLRWREAK